MPPSTGAATSGELSVVVTLMLTFGGAAVVALLLQRLRVALIPAYLLTGILLGPHLLGLVNTAVVSQEVSHLAMVLLMFGIGLEIHLGELRHDLMRLAAVGTISCLLTTMLGWPIARAVGLAAPAALAVSMALSLSSTALVLRILAQRRELQHATGRLALAILVLQDILVLAMLAMLPLLIGWGAGRGLGGSGGLELSGWRGAILQAVLRSMGIAALTILGRLFLPRILSESLRTRSLEVLLIVGLAAALGTATAAKLLGFSLEIGAFLAGFLLSETAFRHQLSGQIGPLRDLFMALFFVTLGFEIDPALAISESRVLLVGVLGLLLLKSAAIAGTSWCFGATAATSLAVGLQLAQGGEFSLVLFSAARRGGLLTTHESALCIAIVFVTLCVAPGLIQLGARLTRVSWGATTAPWIRPRPWSREEGGDASAAPVAVIAGFGPVGREAAAALFQAGRPHAIIELNPRTAAESPAALRHFYFGDAGNPEVLRAAGLEQARLLALTIPDERAVIRACVAARHMAPDIFIVARVVNARRRTAALEHGADLVIVDETATADAMLAAVRAICLEPQDLRRT